MAARAAPEFNPPYTKDPVMNRNGTSISRIIVGALLTALPAATALASEPEASVTARGSAPATAQVTSSPAPDVITPEGAEMMAQRYRNQVQRYRAMGGVAYKAGLVQRAEADATKYAALAVQLRTPTPVAAPRPPEAERYA